jgi:hypothetical protein
MQFQPEREQRNSNRHEKAGSFPIPARIPVFPLPNLVFFPRTYLPLHIFEPRYRAMVADVAGRGQCIGMGLLKEGWEADYAGNPEIFPVGCVGRLVSIQQLPDGRSNILLQGLERYEIREEFYDKSYREATITVTPRRRGSRLDPATRRYLTETLDDYLHSREDSPAWQGIFRQDVSDEILVNSLSSYLDCTPIEKQFLLEAEGLEQHARRLCDLIQFKIDERYGTKGLG